MVPQNLRDQGVVIAEGESITHDGRIIATAKQHCFKGAVISPNAFEWIGHPEPSKHDRITNTPGITEFTNASGRVELHIEIDGELRVIYATP